MAIYHFSAQVIGRTAGRSAVAAAAYRSGQSLFDERTGTECSYRRADRIAHVEILAPANAPAWALDRAQLWNRVEAGENRSDSQLAREFEISLPVELTLDQQIKLVRGWVAAELTPHGVIADSCIHIDKPRPGKPANPHVHIQNTMRALAPDGTSFGLKLRDLNEKKMLNSWRESWAAHTNLALERAGHDARVDHRSFVDAGIEAEPTIKEGSASREIEDRGGVSDRMETNRSIRLENAQRAAQRAALAALRRPIQRSDYVIERLIGSVPSGTNVRHALIARRLPNQKDDRGTALLTTRARFGTFQPLVGPAPVSRAPRSAAGVFSLPRSQLVHVPQTRPVVAPILSGRPAEQPGPRMLLQRHEPGDVPRQSADRGVRATGDAVGNARRKAAGIAAEDARRERDRSAARAAKAAAEYQSITARWTSWLLTLLGIATTANNERSRAPVAPAPAQTEPVVARIWFSNPWARAKAEREAAKAARRREAEADATRQYEKALEAAREVREGRERELRLVQITGDIRQALCRATKAIITFRDIEERRTAQIDWDGLSDDDKRMLHRHQTADPSLFSDALGVLVTEAQGKAILYREHDHAGKASVSVPPSDQQQPQITKPVQRPQPLTPAQIAIREQQNSRDR